MLNKHYTTAVLTLAILVTWGSTSKSVASSDKVKSYSFLKDKITTLQENSFVRSTNPTIKSQEYYNHGNNSKETILVQDVAPEANGTQTDENQSSKLWWLVPLLILVPFLGFLLLKSGSSSKTEQIDEQEIGSENRTDIPEVSSPTPQNIPSEFAVDSSVTDELTQENAGEDAKVEELDNISTETDTVPQVLDDIEEQVENTNIPPSEAIKTQSESYEQDFSLEDNSSLEESIPTASFLEAEEVISEQLPTPQSELASTDVKTEDFESISAEELTTLEKITQSQPDVLTQTEEMSAETTSEHTEQEHTEQITDQDLANISEWLNEKIESDNKDISVMDDFWDNLSSLTEEISKEIPPEHTEQITDRELANISEWLNEKIDSNSNLSDVASNDVDDLVDIVEGKETDSNEELSSNNLNLAEEQNQNNKTKEGISDSTSNFLEELLNEDSSQERKY